MRHTPNSRTCIERLVAGASRHRVVACEVAAASQKELQDVRPRQLPTSYDSQEDLAPSLRRGSTRRLVMQSRHLRAAFRPTNVRESCMVASLLSRHAKGRPNAHFGVPRLSWRERRDDSICAFSPEIDALEPEIAAQ
jgi:hypothetical protein